MDWSFNPDRPIYIQLKEKIKLLIVSGVYPAGAKLPSVRDMASDASVNPNTLQKALTELEREGLVYTNRTSGRFVTEDENMVCKVKNKLAQEQARDFLEKMKRLGFENKEILSMIKTMLEEVKQ